MPDLNSWILISTFSSLFLIFLSYYIKLRRKRKIQMKFFAFYLTEKKGWAYKLEKKFTIISRIRILFKNTKSDITMRRFIVVSLICGMILGIIGYIATTFPVLGILIGLGAAAIPYLRLVRKDKKRVKEIALQFAPMLKHLANYVRAGNNLRQAIEKTALVTEGRLGEELGEIVKGINAGETLNRAIEISYERVPLVEFKMFHIIINIHNDMGGNLANSIDNLAGVIEEKKVLRNEIDNLTQETKVSAYITAVVPTILYVAMRFSSPEYLKQLESLPFGKLGLLLSFVFIMLGVLVVNKMSDVKVDKAYR